MEFLFVEVQLRGDFQGLHWLFSLLPLCFLLVVMLSWIPFSENAGKKKLKGFERQLLVYN